MNDMINLSFAKLEIRLAAFARYRLLWIVFSFYVARLRIVMQYGIASVSYTHLDVYKRQVWQGVPQSTPLSSRCFSVFKNTSYDTH